MACRWLAAPLLALVWAAPAAAQECPGLKGSHPGAVMVAAATAIDPTAAARFSR